MDVPPTPLPPTQQLEDAHAPFFFVFYLFVLMTLIASIITFPKKNLEKKNVTLDPRQKDRLFVK